MNRSRRHLVTPSLPIVGDRYRSGARLAIEASPRLTVLLIRSGEVELLGAFESLRARQGEIVIVAPEVRLSGRLGEGTEILAVVLHEQWLIDVLHWVYPVIGGRRQLWREFRDQTPPVRALTLPEETFASLEQQLAAIIDLPEHTPSLTALHQASGVFATLQGMFDREYHFVLRSTDVGPAVPALLRREVARAQHLLATRYAQPWTIETLAREVGLSVSALTRAFRKELGLTPFDYLRRVRLARFETLVAAGGTGIDEAARAVGWASAAQVRRVIRSLRGVTPSELRFRNPGAS